MKKNIKTSYKFFSGPGIQLKQRVCTEVGYYNKTEKSVDVKGKFCEKTNGFPPRIYIFMNNFLSMYSSKDGNYRNSLMFCLLKNYVAKANVN